MKNTRRILVAIALLLLLPRYLFAAAFVMPAIPPVGPTDTSTKAQGIISSGGAAFTGSVVVNPIGTPSAPVVTTNGTPGSTSLVYACTAVDINGNATIPSATTTITTAAATLTATNSVNITCGGQPGAFLYIIQKTNTSSVLGTCYTTPGAPCTVIDNGTVTSLLTYTPNTVDQTGGLAGTNSAKNSCGGSVATAAGTIEVISPCIANYTLCNCISQNNAAGACSCKVTSTATVVSSATVTVAAFVLNNAATPSPSPVDNWWAGPQ
jgi:hypothetical protein